MREPFKLNPPPVYDEHYAASQGDEFAAWFVTVDPFALGMAGMCRTDLAYEDTMRALRMAWDGATKRAAAICRGVNNYDNPMTANDCADEIERGLTESA
jgi:hypothetical protein